MDMPRRPGLGPMGSAGRFRNSSDQEEHDMARVTIVEDELRVELEGMHKIWALKNSISVPMAHVVGATADSRIAKESKGIRSPGTHIPGLLAAGTWHKDGEKVFWDVRDASKTVVIELRDESYVRLVLEVADPTSTVALINGWPRDTGRVT